MANERRYDHTTEELKVRIDAYFDELEADPKRKGSIDGFLRAVDMTFELALYITNDAGVSYKKEAEMMRAAAQRLRDHIATSPAWSGQNTTKSIFLLKQKFWDGISYSDGQEAKVNGKLELAVNFEQKDAFK